MSEPRTNPRSLRIGQNLEVPTDFVTQTCGILGKRGVGKTHAASVIAEELLEHGLQAVILDPIGVWHGLRSSADGKSAGFPILVLGGDRGDLPLDAGAGVLVADFIVTKRASAVIDMSLLGKGEQARFVGEFLERLYHRNRAPLHLVIDEADAFAPPRSPRSARGRDAKVGPPEGSAAALSVSFHLGRRARAAVRVHSSSLI